MLLLTLTLKYVNKIVDTLRVRFNQWQISKISLRHQVIFLKPTSLRKIGGGNIEHYYHFIFDLILPLYFTLRNSPTNVVFYLEEFGIFSKRPNILFPNRTKIIFIEKELENTKKMPLLGMNPNWVILNSTSLQDFKKYIFKNLEFKPTKNPNKIILVERIAPNLYYQTRAKLKGGGNQRRSLVNHSELSNALSSLVNTPYEFSNLQLEHLSLKEQIIYFDSARLVIAQHGAALANCLWMQPKTMVIEVSENPAKDFFKTICRKRGIYHFIFPVENKHASIEIDQFIGWLLNTPMVKNFFSKKKKADIN